MSLNILIVDDSEIVRRVIKKTLDIAEIHYTELYEAGNGKEALDILNDTWVDLIFTDINMPIMGGVEMVKKLSEDEVLEDVPIVVVSTEGSKSRIDQLKKNGVSAYLRKPVTPEQLRDIVFDLIGGEKKMSDDYSDVLYKVLEESLENLAFMFAEEVDINEIAINDTECVKVSMEFTGDLYNGSLMMILPNNIASELAANILGIDDFSDDAADLGKDSLKEVLNVICGRVLTEISGDEPLFDLSIPVLEEMSQCNLEQYLSNSNMCCAIVDDMYPIIMKFEQK